MSELALGFKEPLSRKEHICDWCGQTIEKNTKYCRWTWIDGGSATTVKAHKLCYEYSAIVQHDICEPIYFDRSEDRVWRIFQ